MKGKHNNNYWEPVIPMEHRIFSNRQLKLITAFVGLLGLLVSVVAYAGPALTG